MDGCTWAYRLNRRTLEVLGRYHRDNLARALWRILLSQPRWLLLGARALAQSLRGDAIKGHLPVDRQPEAWEQEAR